MKFAGILAVIAALVLSIGSVMAVPPGKTVEFAGGAKGKVIFDGKAHADKGLKCPDCHTNPKLFEMKKGQTFTMAQMAEGKACGACHNGTKSFSVKTEADCVKCHKK